MFAVVIMRIVIMIAILIKSQIHDIFVRTGRSSNCEDCEGAFWLALFRHDAEDKGTSK